MLLYYIRHSDPIYDPDGLTPLGERQSEAVARRLAQHGIDKIYSSDSNRAKETARPLAEMLKKDVTELPWANEGRFFQNASGIAEDGSKRFLADINSWAELYNSPEVRKMGNDWVKHPEIAKTNLPEGIATIQREADALLLAHGFRHDHEKCCYFREKASDERVALFAHAAFGKAFLSCVLDIPYPLFATRHDISHSSVTVIRFVDRGFGWLPQLMTYSNDSHLYAENLPTKYNNDIYI